MPYRFTPKRLAASRANLEKAWAAHRAQRARRPERPSALRHGFYALDLRQSVILTGEEVREYDEHLRRFERVFTPTNKVEGLLVRRMAEATWRLLRSYRVRAHLQAKKLRQALEDAAPYSPNEPEGLKGLVSHLVASFTDEENLLQCVTRLRNQFERLFRVLLIERTGSDQGFRIFSSLRLSKWDRTIPSN